MCRPGPSQAQHRGLQGEGGAPGGRCLRSGRGGQFCVPPGLLRVDVTNEHRLPVSVEMTLGFCYDAGLPQPAFQKLSPYHPGALQPWNQTLHSDASYFLVDLT